MALDGTRVPPVAEAESDDDEENVENQHHDSHPFRHLPAETKAQKRLISKQD